MALSRHKAIVAGLALTLTLGTAAAPAVATLSTESPTTDTDPNGMGAPLPADYDKADFYQGTEGETSFAKLRSASRLAPVSLSDEMKYFTKFESNCNYDQGLSYGDGYNAMGYYQFDRRYSLMPFIQQVYNQNPTKYAMFKSSLDNKATLSSSSYSMYDYNTKQLTGLAQDLNDAWHAAYKADPEEFSALQDAYAYNEYYLPVQSLLLNKYGVDIRNRADCVKGLVWGMCNLFGQGGVRNYFNDANISNDMTDRELVTALCDTVIERVTYYCSSQPQYWAGWQNRYRNEKKICLEYIAADEAEASKPGDSGSGDAGTGDTGSGDAGSGDTGSGSTGNSGSGSTGSGDTGSGDASGSGGSNVGDDNSADNDNSGSNGTGSGDSGTSGGGSTAQPDDDSSSDTGSSNSGNNGAGGNGSGGSNVGDDNSADNGNVSDDNSSSNGSNGGNGIGGGNGSNSSGDTSTGDSNTTTGDNNSTNSNGSSSDANGDSSTSGDDTTADNTSKDDAGDTTGGDKKTDDASNQTGEKSADDKKPDGATEQTSSTKGGLPQTGDIAGLVMTGAAGLAVAGASFISLGKLERKKRDDE